MNDLIYVGAVLVGAGTLLVEAFRNFNSQTGDHPFSLHPILKEVEVRNLCTTGEVIAGFAFYAALYLIVYTVVLGSAQVYELLVSASKARSEIGATDNVLLPGSDPLLLTSTDYGKPIFVSALLISFLSIGAVKPIEATMRSLAHRLAGIPRGVYKVIESLREVSYGEFLTDQPGPFVMRFRQAVESISKDKEYSGKCDAIEETLATIDYLSIATNSDNRMLYFPLYTMSELTDLSDRLDDKLGKLSASIDGLRAKLQPVAESRAKEPDMREKWDALSSFARDAALARSDTMAVFAVLFVRNNRSVFSQSGMRHLKDSKSPEATTPMGKTIKSIQEKYNSEQNSFGISLVVALIVGSILTFLVYERWHERKLQGNPQVYSEEARALEKEVKAGQTQLSCKPVTDECKKDEAIRRYTLSQRPILIEATAWDTIHSGVVLFLSVFFVLAGREVRIEQQSWRTDWRFYQFPFLTLLGMSLLSGLIAVFASATVRFAQLAWDVDFHLTQTQIIFLFEQSGAFYILHFGAGVLLSFAALVIMDKHYHLSVVGTLGISVFFSIVYFVYMWIVIFLTYGSTLPSSEQHLRDAFIFSLVPFFFLCVFSITLELTEQTPIRRNRPARKLNEYQDV